MKWIGKSATLTSVVFLLFAVISIQAAATATKPIRIEAKGVVGIVLPYDFDVVEKDFPDLALPDNAILMLAGEDSPFRPEMVSITQGGKVFKPVGSSAYYFWGAFYAIYFDIDFNKFQPYTIKIGEISKPVAANDIALLNGSAKSIGQQAWVDPVNETSVRNSPALGLPDLIARGRALEYSNEALGLRAKGGIALVRASAINALERKDYVRAACLSGEALKWSMALEPPDIRPLGNFGDWVTMARAFSGMGESLASMRAYDEALKIRKDKLVQKERQAVSETYGKKGADPQTGPYLESLSEAELALVPHGQIPIPATESGVIREGISAEGVFIGDMKERIRAQCGEPSEAFSGLLLYTGHPTCPQAIFFTADDRAYAVRSVRGKTIKGVSVGDALSKAESVYGPPDRKESGAVVPKEKPTVRWTWAKLKIAFVDLDGDGKIDAVDIFDYTLNRL